MKLNRKKMGINLSQLLILSVLFVFILMPFIRMLMNIKPGDFYNVTHSLMFKTAITNSLKTCFVTTVISVSLGLLLALALQRSNIRFKAFCTVLATLPMLMPSLSVGTS
ncbi:MAG: hypothetical protein IJI05_04610, partial [Erysipelotrichaceae bacterium]|nr:hypothetical protein [Erysipelotrichaceae bacterium]